MIIMGTKGKTKKVGEGQFYCPLCGQLTHYTHHKIIKQFTLYFIPLFKLQDIADYVECDKCGRDWKPEILTISN